MNMTHKRKITKPSITQEGDGSIDAVNSADEGLRPAITVVNTVYTNGGDGTATNPYKLYFKKEINFYLFLFGFNFKIYPFNY